MIKDREHCRFLGRLPGAAYCHGCKLRKVKNAALEALIFLPNRTVIDRKIVVSSADDGSLFAPTVDFHDVLQG